MNVRDKTAYCGIYCPDCMLFNNRFSPCAASLKEELEKADFDKYAAIKSPFGRDFSDFDRFKELLDDLAVFQCNQPCRPGGGCSGTPCEIMKCCLSKNYEGCWECSEVDACEKFAFLTPRCGDMPKRNIRLIREHGIEKWESERAPFYIWKK